MESQMTCEKCGNTGHSGKSCPFTQEDENSIGKTLPMTQTAVLSMVGILGPTSPSANSKETILITVLSPRLKTSCTAKNK